MKIPNNENALTGVPVSTRVRPVPCRRARMLGGAWLASIGMAFLWVACSSPPPPPSIPIEPADLVFLGEHIVTIDPATAGAEGVAGGAPDDMEFAARAVGHRVWC